MASRLIELPWDSQPQDAAQPAGIFDAVVLPSARALVVPGAPLSITGGASYLADIAGVGVRTNGGSSDSVVVASDGDTLLSLSEATIIWHGGARVLGINGEFGLFNTTAARRIGAHVPYTDGVVYWDFGGTTAGTTRLTASGLTTSVKDVWAFTTGPRGMEIWQNGVLRASNAATPTRSPSTSAFGIGRHATSTGSDQTTTFAFAYARRQLGAEFLARITQSPGSMWGELFEPRRIYIPGAVAGGGLTPILSAATWASLTSTTVRPRVTLTF